MVIVLVAAWFLGWRSLSASAAATNNRLQTATVQRGSLVATVNAAGNITAPSDADLAFQTTGRVAKVNVQVGDAVKTGQVLMELDTTDLNLALKTAQANLASAQANFDANANTVQQSLKTAQGNLDSAKANYDAAKQKNDQSPNQLIVAKLALDKATNALQQAQGAYDAISWRGDVSGTSQAATLASAHADYDSALANYKITAAGINDTSVRAAQASVDNAQTALDQAQHNLDTSTRTAQAQLDSAKLGLDQAQRNLDKTKIIAPFDGTISAVNFSGGDTAGSTTAVSMVDLTHLQVKVTIAEVDLPKIKVGETAQMTLDAVAGKTYQARVQEIGPVGTVTQGVVNYPVVVVIDKADAAVKPGMTANLAVAVDRRDNVLLLPNRSVRTQGTQKIVTALYKGQQIQVPIETGLSNDQSVEVMSGLQEGDVVLLNQTQTQTQGGRGGGIPFLGVGGGR